MNDKNMMERDPSMANMGPGVMLKVPRDVYNELIAAWEYTVGLDAFAPRLSRAIQALERETHSTGG